MDITSPAYSLKLNCRTLGMPERAIPQNICCKRACLYWRTEDALADQQSIPGARRNHASGATGRHCPRPDATEGDLT